MRCILKDYIYLCAIVHDCSIRLLFTTSESNIQPSRVSSCELFELTFLTVERFASANRLKFSTISFRLLLILENVGCLIY